MRNSGNEAKRMWLETGKVTGLMTTVLMDSKADAQAVFRELQRQRERLRLTTARKGADNSPARQRLVKGLHQRKNQTLDTQRGMLLLTTPRKGAAKSPERQRMMQVLKQKKHQQLYKQRSYTVEPMQGLLTDIFELERWWMRGNSHTRWRFAAMGVAVQMQQSRAWPAGRSPWAIKQEALGR
jgi:hypothetical protein